MGFSSDIHYIVTWWLTIFLIGLIFLPLNSLLFSRFVDRGYIFCKIVGILFTSYIMWLLSSLHTLPFTRLSIVIILLATTLINLWIIARASRKNVSERFPWRWLIFEEILFFLCLAFWSFV